MATKSKKASKKSANVNQNSKSKKRLGKNHVKKIKGSAAARAQQGTLNLQKASDN